MACDRTGATVTARINSLERARALRARFLHAQSPRQEKAPSLDNNGQSPSDLVVIQPPADGAVVASQLSEVFQNGMGEPHDCAIVEFRLAFARHDLDVPTALEETVLDARQLRG